MGIVASATHLELGNQVAVKFLRDEYAQNPTIVERFIREARAVVTLRTEHVCRVIDVGRLDSGAPYIVMEMLHGADLSQAIAKRPLPVTTAVDYIMQACVALAEAHSHGIVHRDIKPANLFVTRRPDGGPLVKVLDFGIAKAMDNHGPALTHTSGMMGSPGYMSPEQLMSARDVDLRTDIWALGVTLYQLVSGTMPFAAPTITEIAIKVAADTPPPLAVDPGLSRVIFRCLEKAPAARYGSRAATAARRSPPRCRASCQPCRVPWRAAHRRLHRSGTGRHRLGGRSRLPRKHRPRSRHAPSGRSSLVASSWSARRSR
jgi:eukaryotic-like serine/threonine-protein kinase